MGLTNGQSVALDKALTTRKHLIIKGPAGCGKSYLSKSILDGLGMRMGIALSAPTHQAKKILSKMAGMEANTLHSLLRIHPDTYEDVRTFQQNKKGLDLSALRVLFIDEVSMLDDELTDITLKSIPKTCRIIGIGDEFQIQPVKHLPGVISPVFTDPRFDTVELTEIVRQAAENPMIIVATEIRHGGWFRPLFDQTTKMGIIKAPSRIKLLDTYLRKVGDNAEFSEDYRLMAYTNNVIDTMNRFVRKQIYNTYEPFWLGEKLVMQEPVVLDIDGSVETLLNNGEVVTIKKIEPRTAHLNLPLVGKLSIEVADLVVIGDEEMDVNITVLWGESEEERFFKYMDKAASEYKSTGSGIAQKKMWSAWWDVKNTYVSTKPIFACTLHKSQGSTFKGAFIHTPDIISHAPHEIATQLAYVGSTRAQQFCVYY